MGGRLPPSSDKKLSEIRTDDLGGASLWGVRSGLENRRPGAGTACRTLYGDGVSMS